MGCHRDSGDVRFFVLKSMTNIEQLLQKPSAKISNVLRTSYVLPLEVVYHKPLPETIANPKEANRSLWVILQNEGFDEQVVSGE